MFPNKILSWCCFAYLGEKKAITRTRKKRYKMPRFVIHRFCWLFLNCSETFRYFVCVCMLLQCFPQVVSDLGTIANDLGTISERSWNDLRTISKRFRNDLSTISRSRDVSSFVEWWRHKKVGKYSGLLTLPTDNKTGYFVFQSSLLSLSLRKAFFFLSPFYRRTEKTLNNIKCLRERERERTEIAQRWSTHRQFRPGSILRVEWTAGLGSTESQQTVSKFFRSHIFHFGSCAPKAQRINSQRFNPFSSFNSSKNIYKFFSGFFPLLKLFPSFSSSLFYDHSGYGYKVNDLSLEWP